MQIESLQIRIASEIARCPAEAVAFVWDAVHQYFARVGGAQRPVRRECAAHLPLANLRRRPRRSRAQAGSYEAAWKLLLDAVIANSTDVGRVIDALSCARDLLPYRLSPVACDFAGLMLFDGLVAERMESGG